jgi:hypothetical protein
MSTTVPFLHFENTQIFDHLEDGPPPEFQKIQHTVTMFMNVRAPEKRIKLLEALVCDTPDPVLALALACKPGSTTVTHGAHYQQVMKHSAMLLKTSWSKHFRLQPLNLPVLWLKEQSRNWMQYMPPSQRVTLQGTSASSDAPSCMPQRCLRPSKE